MPMNAAPNASMYIRCALPPGSFGGSRRRRMTSSTSICGMTILNTPDDPGSYPALQNLPRDEDGPVFAEPWQAQAFALAVRLSAQGYFTWKEWADTLAAELAAAVERDEADDGSEYYHHWVAALEKLVAAKGMTGEAELYERKEAWADAYRHTPHGKPIELR